MAEAKARLGSIFGTNGSSDASNDPLKYSAPKEPVRGAAAPASSTPAESQNIIYTTSVTLFKYDSAKKSYASCSSSPVGCVILGNNAAYSLLFYNAAKEHLSLSPVTLTLQATLQPGQYVNFYDAAGDNYSARFSTEVDAQTFIRTLFLTKVHVGIWGGGSISPNALMKEELSSAPANAPTSRAIAEGDTVGIAFSAWRVVGNAGSSPLDVVTKYAPFEKVQATELRKFRVGDKTERISALEEGVVGMKKGGHRIVLVPPGKTNGKDWYILQIELVKIKSDTKEPKEAAAPRANPEVHRPTASEPAAPAALSNDLVIYEKEKEDIEKRKQELLEREREFERRKEQQQQQQQPPMSMYGAPPSYGGVAPSPYGMPTPPPSTSSMYPWMMAPPPMLGKPLDALVMEINTKVDHLIRIAPGNGSATSSLSSLTSMTDASQTLRGVERLVGENERLLQQITLQTQQFNAYEAKYDDLQKSTTKLTAEKAQWKDQLALHQSELANVTAARDTAINQLNRMHQEVQQLRFALYQKSTSEQDMAQLTFERDSRARAETALKNETAARSIAEQELNLVKKQLANLTSLHESEVQSQRMSHDRAVAQLQDQHRQEIEALRQQFEREKMALQQSQPSSLDLQKENDELRMLAEQWKANAAATAQEVQALNAEKALRIERIGELEQMQAFHANAREQEVQQLQEQVADLEAKLRAGGGSANGVGIPGEPCERCAESQAKLDKAVVEMVQKEEAAKLALQQAEELKKEAQELLLSSPAPPSSSNAANVSEMFKEVVNDIFFRFQDLFEDEVALDGNQVLKEIKKVLKQSTKEVLANLEETGGE
ncbi:hypothetical protein LEN26_021330 [Aphanomyces euteiches]|nr:hypothetical protein LEN26_021330 [Aphanomyces euteiches]